MMYREHWLLATVGVLLIPLFTIPTRWAGKTRWTLTRDAQACSDEINGILNETLSVSGQLLVKLFGKENYEYGRYEAVNRRIVILGALAFSSSVMYRPPRPPPWTAAIFLSSFS